LTRGNLFHRIWKERSAYFFILPTLIGFLFFSLKPLIEGIRLSFYEANLRQQVFIGLDNYSKVFQDPFFWLSLKNTFLFVVVLVPLILFISLFIALVISKLSSFWQSFFKGAFYLPAVSAGVVMSLVWLWIFNSTYGLFNYILSIFHILPITWLGDDNPARVAIIIVVISWVVGMKIILYSSALAAIPKSIYEASEIDGANSWQKFWNITWPLITPMTIFLLVTLTIGISQIWEAIFLLTGGGPHYATTSLVLRIYQLGFLYFRFGEASVYAVVLLMIVFTIAFFQFRYLNKKLEF